MKSKRSLVGNYSAMRRLTLRQQECLAMLKRFYADHQRMPTTKELQHQMGDCSRNTIRPMLARLVDMGHLRWLPHGSLNVQFALPLGTSRGADAALGTQASARMEDRLAR